MSSIPKWQLPPIEMIRSFFNPVKTKVAITQRVNNLTRIRNVKLIPIDHAEALNKYDPFAQYDLNYAGFNTPVQTAF